MKKRNSITRSQLIGAVVFIVMLIALATVVYFSPRPMPEEPTVGQTDTIKSIAKQKYKNLRFQRKKYIFNPRLFDPNTADSLTLVELGFKDWQANNIIKYRAAGGKFKTKESLKKVYGMTDSLYAIIESWIEIDSTLFIVYKDTTIADTLKYFPLKKDTIIELNSADTLSLQFIKGIGSYRAKRIIQYREELGGYISAQQIRELKFKLTESELDSIIVHLYAEKDSVKPIDVNHSSLRRLTQHPYLSFEQAREIYELRRKRVKLNDINSLHKLPSLTEDDIKRLELYLTFL